jgi:hypothetical protein
VSKKLKALERKMRAGFGVITEAEGLNYFFQYVDEAIRVITTETSKLQK